MKKSLTFKLACCALALLFAIPLAAVAADGPRMAETWFMVVKAGHQADFEAAFKAHGAIRGQNEDPQNWDVYTPVTGNEVGSVYAIRSCCFNWADKDAHTDWEASHPEVMGDWFTNAGQHVESYSHYFYEMDIANSHWPESGGPYKYMGITEWALQPGKEADFDTAKKKISQIAINNGWATDDRVWGWTSRIGGKPLAGLAVPFKNFADMTPGEETFAEFLSSHLGAEKTAELMSQFSSSTKGSKYTIWAHRPDLSSADK